jgi:hypothetical protein
MHLTVLATHSCIKKCNGSLTRAVDPVTVCTESVTQTRLLPKIHKSGSVTRNRCQYTRLQTRVCACSDSDDNVAP